MKATSASKSKPAGQAFRVILRGHDKAGNYRRAVRVVHATSEDAAYGYLAENGEKIAKEVPFKVEFTNVFPPA